jgi:YVTN family beta-propeller protein
VATAFTDNVSVISTFTNTVVATIPVGSLPEGVAVTPDGTRAYVANLGTNSVSVIDTTTNAVTATILFDFSASEVAITPDGTRAYVTHPFSIGRGDGISVIDTATNTVTATIPVVAPSAIAITSDGARAYVGTHAGTVVGINTATNSVVSTVDGLPCGPNSIALTPAPLVPTTKDDCRNGGYRRFGPPAGPFRNQGQCISYVQRQSRERH